MHQVVYCAASRSLCQLEKRVHANGATLKDQALMRLDLPDKAQLECAQALGLLSDDWRASEASTQRIGNAWLAQGTAVGLWVPSYVEPHDQNLLLNPAHRDFARIQLVIERQPFHFDPRLFI
jgi:RES domain-containing protein